MHVNRRNVVKALVWLKRHNPFYANVCIRVKNFDWMEGEDEVSISTNAIKLKNKNSKQARIIADKSEYESSAHITFDKNVADIEAQEDIELNTSAMHANQKADLPRGKNADIIKSFINIVKATGQTSEIMHFLPIDHDSPIR